MTSSGFPPYFTEYLQNYVQIMLFLLKKQVYKLILMRQYWHFCVKCIFEPSIYYLFSHLADAFIQSDVHMRIL